MVLSVTFFRTEEAGGWQEDGRREGSSLRAVCGGQKNEAELFLLPQIDAVKWTRFEEGKTRGGGSPFSS